jgi:hypothetical protein
MRRWLIMVGVMVLIVGLAWPWLSRLPLGRLPGDFTIDRPGAKFHFPLATSLLLSAVVSAVLWLLRR